MTGRPLGDYVRYEMSDANVERLWETVESRRLQGKRRHQRRRVAVWGGLAVAAGILMGWGLKTTAPLQPTPLQAAKTETTTPEQGATLTSSDESMAVSLRDGSSIHLAPRSNLALHTLRAKEVRLALGEGQVTCDVTKNTERSFSVLAGPVRVRVIGTKFVVDRKLSADDQEITVTVERGIVEVTGPGSTTKSLSRGESWTVRLPRRTAQASPSPEDPSPEEGDEPESAPVDSKSWPDEPAAKEPPKPEPELDLFAQARNARRAGSPGEAAAKYERFLNTSPGDARAGLAALELARLKMDHLSDVAGAIPWLRQAARLGAGGLGDDALARLVRAHAVLGNRAACRKTRAQYLKSYPAGVHVRQIESLCR